MRAHFTFLEVGMATKQGILEALVGESGSITAAALAAKMELKPSDISSQVGRCVAAGEIAKSEEGLTITEKGGGMTECDSTMRPIVTSQ